MKKNLLFVAVFALFVMISCSKKDDKSSTPEPTPTPKPSIELLTSAKWKLKALTINPGIRRGSGFVTDLYADLSSWNLDNTRLFDANGSGFDDEGPTKLQTTDPQILPLTWSFNSDKTKITINFIRSTGVITYTYDITQLDENTMKLSLKQDGANVSGGIPGTSYVTVSTFSH